MVPFFRVYLLALVIAPLPVFSATAIEEVIVTSTRLAELSSTLVGNSSALDSDTLNMVSSVHIQEALSRLPGVGLHRNNGQEYLPAIRSPVLTGSGACGSFLMAEDGIPLRPAGFCNVNELFEAHSEQAQRIEVIRGPGNALYGSNALHGVVNIIAPAAFDRGLTLGFEAGPHDYGRIKISAGLSDFAFSFTGSSDGGYRDDSGVDQQKLSLRHRYQGSGIQITSGLTAINLNQETAGFIVGTDAYKDSNKVETNPNPEAYRDASAVRLWSRIESQQDSYQWLITPYIRYSDMAFFQHFLPGQPLEENGQHSAGVQTALFLTQKESRLTIGLDVEISQGWLKQTQNLPTQGSAFLQATIPQGKHYDYQVNAVQIAPFVQWQKTFNKRLKVSAGLRYEYMAYDYDNRMVNGRSRDDGTLCGFGGCRYSRPADSTDRFNNLSPQLGILYDLNDSHQLFVTLARGFRAPQTSELYRLQRQQQVADLDSVQLDSFEVGLRTQASALSYEVNVYALRKDKVIFRDSDFFNVSDGKTSHWGVELSVRYQWNPTWDVNLAATMAHHRYSYHAIQNGIDIDGNDVDTAPHHFGSAQLGWNLSEEARLELEWQRMGGYFTDPENLHRYSGHDLIHLRGQWQPSSQWTFSAKLLNLLNTDYAERADYSGFSGDRYFPGEPRGLYLGVEMRY